MEIRTPGRCTLLSNASTVKGYNLNTMEIVYSINVEYLESYELYVSGTEMRGIPKVTPLS
jgi:hypothetical protein